MNSIIGAIGLITIGAILIAGVGSSVIDRLRK
jgi:hypothetical protein